MASQPEWMQRVYRALHERRGDLLPLLDRFAKEAEENNSYDELYYINYGV